jgi:hypothetical protein
VDLALCVDQVVGHEGGYLAQKKVVYKIFISPV